MSLLSDSQDIAYSQQKHGLKSCKRFLVKTAQQACLSCNTPVLGLLVTEGKPASITGELQGLWTYSLASFVVVIMMSHVGHRAYIAS